MKGLETMLFEEELGKAAMFGLEGRAKEGVESCLGIQGLEFQNTEFEFCLCYLLAVQAWTNYFVSLNFQVIIHKRRILIEFTLWVQF